MIFFRSIILEALLLIFFLAPEGHLVPSRSSRNAPVFFPDSSSVVSRKAVPDQDTSITDGANPTMAISFKKAAFRTQEEPGCHTEEGKQNYCENDSEYNELAKSHFDKLIENIPIANFITDVLDEDVLTGRPETRIQPEFVSERPLCFSVETIIYPKRGRTIDDDWVFILNQGKMKQGIKVEKCIFENQPCDLGGGNLTGTVCRQKYIYRKLLTVGATGDNIVTESVFMPSCCVCYTTSDFISPKVGPEPAAKN